MPIGDRLLFVSSSSRAGGPTNSLLLLLEHFRRDRDVAVLLPDGGPFVDTLQERGIRFFSLPALTKRYLPRMAGLVRREGFDLVYSNNTRGPSRLAFLAAAFQRVPFVCHVRSMEWDKSWVDLAHLRWADAVIAVSRACADSVRRFVPGDRLHVVYNGVPILPHDRSGRARRREILARIGVSEESQLLLNVSHVCDRKGQEHAVRAMKPVLERNPDAVLCIAGSLNRQPDYVERLTGLIRAAGLEDRVRLLGFRDDVTDLLQAADLYVHTAVEDPHPRSVIEAMAAGLPVVAFSVDGVSETVVNGETGRLVAVGDWGGLARAILEIACANGAARRMGTAGRSRVERCFSDRATAGQVSEILERAVSARRGKDRGDDR